MPDASQVSPRGVPPIRTDWLADVAWRFAALGLEALRTSGAEGFTATDTVDGERWELRPYLFAAPTESRVELDGDLLRPDASDATDLRFGVAMTPIFDGDHGRQIQVRIEIGPRGPVTFDPENWIFTFPLDRLASGKRPAVPGLDAGHFTLAADPAARELGSLDELGAVRAISLGDLVEIAEGRRTWTTVLGLLHEAPRRRRFGFGGKPPKPVATLTLASEGELRIEPLAPLTDAQLAEIQPVEAVRIDGDEVTIDLPHAAIPGGRLVIGGPGLQARIHRIPPALDGLL